jgi:glycosyltransferase involved in cell wall biosynthesis
MNILHINTSQSGGAALCAMRINNALNSQGIDSRVLFAWGTSLPENIRGAIAEQDNNPWNTSFILKVLRRILVCSPLYPYNKYRIDRQIVKVKHQLGCQQLMHGPLSYFKNISHHPLVEWADIIHLHWVAEFVDYPSFFKNVDKPMVWTLHDHHPAIGILHYESPDVLCVPEKLSEIDRLCRIIKRESLSHVSNLKLVAISMEMAEVCRRSDILKQFPITIINNGVDEQRFKPVDSSLARQALSIPADHIVFAFCAHNMSDERKGLRDLISALELLNLRNISLLCIGGGDIPVKTSVNIIKTGYVKSEQTLSSLYSCADYFVMPSFNEGFAQTPIEAMACGTPVIAYPCSGTEELINDESGIRCDDFSVQSLVEAIHVAMCRNYNRSAIRNRVINNFTHDKIATQYINLYNSILN